MVMSMNPSFFIHNVRSTELKKRLIELTVMREAILNYPREPVKKRTRITSKYKPLLDDYHKLIKEFNETRKVQALMIELIIGLAYQVDFSTNPNTNDEIFTSLYTERRTP